MLPIFIGQPNSSPQKVCCNRVTDEKSLMNKSDTVFYYGGDLLFILRPFIHVITGLAKGEMSLTEFYQTAIIQNKNKDLT